MPAVRFSVKDKGVTLISCANNPSPSNCTVIAGSSGSSLLIVNSPEIMPAEVGSKVIITCCEPLGGTEKLVIFAEKSGLSEVMFVTLRSPSPELEMVIVSVLYWSVQTVPKFKESGVTDISG